MNRQTASVTISLGARIEVTRLDGTVEMYTFKGKDETGLRLYDDSGARNSDALSHPYASVKVIPENKLYPMDI